MTGTITRVVTDKGFGFITGEDGQDYFFHRSAFESELAPHMQGAHVTFEVSRAPKGLRAENVRVVR